MREMICSAIRELELLEFDYDGLHRIVAPYCHGFTSKGEVLRAIQVRGDSHSHGLGFGKLWTVAKMSNVRKAVIDEGTITGDVKPLLIYSDQPKVAGSA